MLVTPNKSTIDTWQRSLEKNGSRSIKIRRLLDAYHLSRRGSKVIAEIQSHLRQLSPPIYAPKLADTTLSLDTSIKLSRTDLGPGGKTYSAALRHQKRRKGAAAVKLDGGEENAFKQKNLCVLLKAIRLKLARIKGEKAMEFSPLGTRDRLDAVCEDQQGNLVAFEFKVRDGERRGVEQLLRYGYQLSASKHRDPRLGAYRDAEVRVVLVTGVADQATREAISTLDPYEIVEWYTYTIDTGTAKLDGVERREVPRREPLRDMVVDKAREVRVEADDVDVTLGLRSYQARLSRTAARKLRDELSRVLG